MHETVSPRYLLDIQLSILGLAIMAAGFAPEIFTVTSRVAGWFSIRVVAVIGLMGDIPHIGAMRAGTTDRLPFTYRMRGWRIGSPPYSDREMYQTWMLHDSRNNRIIPIMRRIE